MSHRAEQTRTRLLDTAAKLLGDVGIERISTNMIAAEAGLTPPSFYRYFRDKYDVLEALGLRLMERQNAVLRAWIAAHGAEGPDNLRAHLMDLFVATAEVTADEAGAEWILRALRAVPRLVEVRVASHRHVTDMLADAIMPFVHHAPRHEVWAKLRIAIEMGFAVFEMAMDEPDIAPGTIMQAASELLDKALVF